MLLGQFVSVGSYGHEFSGDWEDLHDEMRLEGGILICYPIYPKPESPGRSSPVTSPTLDSYIPPIKQKKAWDHYTITNHQQSFFSFVSLVLLHFLPLHVSRPNCPEDEVDDEQSCNQEVGGGLDWTHDKKSRRKKNQGRKKCIKLLSRTQHILFLSLHFLHTLIFCFFSSLIKFCCTWKEKTWELWRGHGKQNVNEVF